jgi:hypothetical protein
MRGQSGPVIKRPKCIGSLRARNHYIFCCILFYSSVFYSILFYSILFYSIRFDSKLEDLSKCASIYAGRMAESGTQFVDRN